MTRPPSDPADASLNAGVPHAGDTVQSAGDSHPGALSEHLRLEPGACPLPDYRLVQFLGRGGFGEVWKALGPGGFAVALKFIPLAGGAAALEERSAELLKTKEIRHPNLLGLFGSWRRDDVLILAMELADRTLLDRLKEAVGQGLPGVPPAELLEYLREAAKGLDVLHTLGVHHRDVKPQNLLLVGGGVKVADFGLAKLLEQTSVTNSGAMTPSYAAPEFLQGRVSAHSDQYALAVAYCQLRGGRLPFVGGAAQVLTGHLYGSPDLTMLPQVERTVVARALAKDPRDRWPSCQDFVQALAATGLGGAPDGASSVRTPSPGNAVTARVPGPRPARPRRLTWTLVGGLLLATAALPVVLIWAGRTPPPADNAAGRPDPAKSPDDASDQASGNGPESPGAPEKPPGPAPSWRLLPVPPVTLEPGKSVTVAVRLERGDGGGPAEFLLSNLPNGVKGRPVDGAGGPDAAAFELTAAADAAPADYKVTVAARVGEARVDGAFSLTVALAKDVVNSLDMHLTLILAGKFRMGSPPDEKGRYDNEGPPHEVEISRPFYLGVRPVTRGQFAAFVGAEHYKTEAERDGRGGNGYDASARTFDGPDPKYSWKDAGFPQDDDHPVVNVTWNDAVKFCEWLSRKEKQTYALPTEAEWEYACRAGTTTRFWCGDDDADLKGAENVRDASLKEKLDAGKFADWTFPPWHDGHPFTSAAGAFRANAWGLYDMHGDVGQWCGDRFGRYPEGAVKDPKGPAGGDFRVSRGGSWQSVPALCRSAARHAFDPGDRDANMGFRVVLRAAGAQ